MNLGAVLYTKQGCGPCMMVKKWLQANNVPYTEAGPEQAIVAGYRSVPVLEYREHVVHGFDINKLKEIFPE